MTESSNMTPKILSANVLAALHGVRFIAQHIRDADKDNEVCWISKTAHPKLHWKRGINTR